MLRKMSVGSALRSEQESADEDNLDYTLPCSPVPRIVDIVCSIPVHDIVLCLFVNCWLIWLAGWLVTVAVFRCGRLLKSGLRVGRHELL